MYEIIKLILFRFPYFIIRLTTFLLFEWLIILKISDNSYEYKEQFISILGIEEIMEDIRTIKLRKKLNERFN